ncbi:WD40-repeat-containing domain protein [Gilbertella persicaria]|uniref:WD40-repeat-containing domain protein n=1 Tax=Gilbertella persicaria TaxID=101096 RepID=UPI0022206467|nr:WD40-repeat-containing domain protein [Gilbertella persicaria]KAI8092286.1 WD40-repeat-containing domain protein [Gilbertella persicaria]
MLLIPTEGQSDLLEKKNHSSQLLCLKHSIQNNGVFVDIKKTHYATSFIQHWQLRDLIYASSKFTLMHPRRNSIYMYDTRLEKDTCFQDSLPFTPTSIHTKCGYLVAGGQTGMLMIKQLESGWSKIWSVGRGLNNSVHLSSHGKNIRMTVCNNDQTVTLWRVPEMDKIQTLKLPSAINATSVSPNQQYMVMVSDGGVAYLYTIDKEGYYTNKLEYKVSEEPSLSCAWHPSSTLFAITSQDGYVSIYSIDSTQRLYHLGSTENRKTKKAPRSIQFSSGTLDLLAYAEHVSHVYIVDTRTFQTRQIVRLSPEHQDQAITGLTFSPDGRTIFVGLEDRIVELQVDCVTRRQFGASRLI